MVDIPNATNTTMAIAASGLKAQQQRLRLIAENLANADSTAQTPNGDPYRRRTAIFEPTGVGGATGVRIARVMPDNSDFTIEHNPGHPAADENGNVKMPNVDPLLEAMDYRDAQRAYEANLTVIETARAMQARTLELLKK